jgi:energy-coupling factor transporter ATP-binding protein EcfA2
VSIDYSERRVKFDENIKHAIIMAKHQTTKVFTPSAPAISTFVEREMKINNHLVDALRTPGKQIVLYGHSGCGKTTLLTNKLNQIYESTVITRCMEGMTFENILIDGFDQLNKFYSETTKTKGFKISPAITVSYKEIKSTISIGEFSSQQQTTSKRVIPPQLTPQRLAVFFGESKSCWVLEDFHKIKGTEKNKISQIMKIFMDMSSEYSDLKLLAIGAVGTARQVIAYDKEMNNRVTEISIPYMNAEEIESIINTGEKLLNLKFATFTKEKIVKYSCGLPSICHQLCLNICFNNEIYETQKNQFSINAADLDTAIEKYVEEKSDTLKAEFDRAVKVSNTSKVNIPKEILKMSLKINKDEFSFNDIFSKLKGKRIKKDEAKNMVDELCSNKRSEILVFDDNSNMYRFNNLFLKAYALLRFNDDQEEIHFHKTGRDEKIVNRLLEIIEKDFSEDIDSIDNINIEELM